MSKKQEIALFGGTFDPIHSGHISLLEEAQKAFGFSKIIVLPCRQSPHKENAPMASDVDRVKMCQLATAHLPFIEVSDLEVRREPPSYSWQTVEHFTAAYPDAELYWIMGTDQWEVLDQWGKYDYLLTQLHFIVIERQQSVSPRENARFTPLHFDQRTSSTEIRKRLIKGENTSDLPKSVYDYIMSNNLY